MASCSLLKLRMRYCFLLDLSIQGSRSKQDRCIDMVPCLLGGDGESISSIGQPSHSIVIITSAVSLTSGTLEQLVNPLNVLI